MPLATAYSDSIREATTVHIRSGLSDTSAADLRTVFGTVAEAVEFFEGLQRGAQILHAAGAPDNALGLDIDAYIDTTTADLYLKEAGEWQLRLALRGKDGTNGRNGTNGTNGTNGLPGASAYQAWLNQGNTGTQAQFLASLKGQNGNDGTNGTNGSKMRWESYAPTNEAGEAGDAWFHTISANKIAIYQHAGYSLQQSGDAAEGGNGSAAQSPWRLRFTSPEATATTTPTPTAPAGVTTFNTRSGAVQLQATDVSQLFEAGTNTTVAIDATSGKIRINATGSTGTGTGTPTTGAAFPAQDATTTGKFLKSTGTAGSEQWAAVPASGHIIKDAAGTTITQPVIIVRNGLRIIEEAGAMAIEADPAGVPALESNQQGIVLNFSNTYQIRSAGAGNITLSDFQSVAIGRKIRLELNPTGANDTLLIGGVQVVGDAPNFQSTVKISPTASSGANQNCTFYDAGGPFISGIRNVLTLECIGTNRFSFTIDPQV